MKPLAWILADLNPIRRVARRLRLWNYRRQPRSVPHRGFVVFHDTRGPDHWWIVIIGPTETFSQKADEFSWDNRKWYVLGESRQDHSACVTMEEAQLPPFEPGAARLCRVLLTEDGDEVAEDFFDSNHALIVRGFLNALESRLEKELATQELPGWVSERDSLSVRNRIEM
jgi:hypothetical protein